MLALRFVWAIFLGMVLLGTARLAAQAPGKQPADARQPNIIVFLVDDMGWQDTSVPFHSEATPFNRRYHTPNMERLAAGGMKFTQAYSCTVCSPTRVSLMTGLNAARHRVTNWILRVDPATDKEHPTLRLPAWNSGGICATSGVPRTVHATPLAEVLRGARYRTIHVGKAHFGAVDTPGADPRNLGFDVNIAGHAAGAPGSYLGAENFTSARRQGDRTWDVPGLEKYRGQDIFLTEALTIEANAAMDAAAADGKPFYLYVAHYAVHTPYSADSRYYQKYRDAGLDHTEAMYAALIEGMDKSLGDLLDNVERHGLSEQTIVLFMSDNGGLSAHARGGRPNTHNKPLASGKGSAYEGGIRVPMIVRWPGVTDPGSSCSQGVIIEDFFPTILEMAGVNDFRQIGGVIDGRSFVGLLHGRHDAARDERPLFWHYPNMWGASGPGIGPSSTIRHGDWKLIYFYTDGHYDLFNLADDLGEQHNLADRQPEIRDRLARELGQYLAGIDAQVPIDETTGQPVVLPGATP